MAVLVHVTYHRIAERPSSANPWLIKVWTVAEPGCKESWEAKKRLQSALMCRAFGSSLCFAGIREALQPEDFHVFPEANQTKDNVLWPCQTSCEPASRARDTAVSALFLQVWKMRDVPQKVRCY